VEQKRRRVPQKGRRGDKEKRREAVLPSCSFTGF
jgi:hypothetical protein